MDSEKPKVSEQLFIEARDSKAETVYFILDLDKPSWAFINKDSLEILNQCNGKNTIHDISRLIADKYAIDLKEALNGVESFLNSMVDIQIVQYNGMEEVDTLETTAYLPIKIQISLDGVRKETHDRIRGKGSFDLALRWLDKLIERGKEKDIVIAFTPTRINVEDVQELIEFALGKGIPVIQFPPLASSGRAKANWDELRLSDAKRLWFWDFISKRSKELKGKLDLLAECFSLDINNPGKPYRCTIGSQLRIAPTGDVYPCQCFHFGSEYCIGNIKEQSLDEIVNSQKLEAIIKTCLVRPSGIEECKDCNWRNFCGAGCMGNAFEVNGTVWTPDSCNVRKQWLESLFQAKFDEIYGMNR